MNIILNEKARVGFDFGIDNDSNRGSSGAMMTIKTEAAGEQREKGY